MKAVFLSLLVLSLVGCATTSQEPAKAVVELEPVSTRYGIASFYYGRWIGRKTANGEIYRAGDVTAAHKTLPFNTRVRVTDLKTGKSTIVRINNRGPYIKGREIDLSLLAARKIGLTKKRGIAKVKLEILPSKEQEEAARLAAQKEAERKREEERPALAKLFAPRDPSVGSEN